MKRCFYQTALIALFFLVLHLVGCASSEFDPSGEPIDELEHQARILDQKEFTRVSPEPFQRWIRMNLAVTYLRAGKVSKSVSISRRSPSARIRRYVIRRLAANKHSLSASHRATFFKTLRTGERRIVGKDYIRWLIENQKNAEARRFAKHNGHEICLHRDLIEEFLTQDEFDRAHKIYESIPTSECGMLAAMDLGLYWWERNHREKARSYLDQARQQAGDQPKKLARLAYLWSQFDERGRARNLFHQAYLEAKNINRDRGTTKGDRAFSYVTYYQAKAGMPDVTWSSYYMTGKDTQARTRTFTQIAKYEAEQGNVDEIMKIVNSLHTERVQNDVLRGAGLVLLENSNHDLLLEDFRRILNGVSDPEVSLTLLLNFVDTAPWSKVMSYTEDYLTAKQRKVHRTWIDSVIRYERFRSGNHCKRNSTLLGNHSSQTGSNELEDAMMKLSETAGYIRYCR